ncbi:MAG: hypothetical protein ACR2MM_07650 [Flavobacteriaceae bacterium]
MHKLKLIITLSLIYTCFTTEAQSIRYQINEEYKGWHPWVKENTIVGERNRRIEAIKILPFDFPAGASIQYRVRVKTAGWQPWVEAGEIAGTEGEDRRIEAIEVKLTNFPGQSVCYWTWTGYREGTTTDIPRKYEACDGQMAGTITRKKPIEQLRIWLTP